MNNSQGTSNSKVLTVEEAKHLHDVIEQNGELKEKILMKLMLYTGIRMSELVNIKVENIDIEMGKIKVYSDKLGQELTLHITDSLKDNLSEYMRQQPTTYLFETSNSRKFNYKIREMMLRYATQANLTQFPQPEQLRQIWSCYLA